MYSTIPLTSLHNKLNSPRAMLHNRQQFSTDISKSATVHFYLLLAERKVGGQRGQPLVVVDRPCAHYDVVVVVTIRQPLSLKVPFVYAHTNRMVRCPSTSAKFTKILSSLKSAMGQGMRSAPSSPTQIGTWPSGTRAPPCRDAFTAMRESRLSERFMLPLSEQGTGVVEVLAAVVHDLTAGVWPYVVVPGMTSRRRCSCEGRAKRVNDISYCINVTLTNHKFYCYATTFISYTIHDT
jgi:hypothetical protein